MDTGMILKCFVTFYVVGMMIAAIKTWPIHEEASRKAATHPRPWAVKTGSIIAFCIMVTCLLPILTYIYIGIIMSRSRRG